MKNTRNSLVKSEGETFKYRSEDEDHKRIIEESESSRRFVDNIPELAEARYNYQFLKNQFEENKKGETKLQEALADLLDELSDMKHDQTKLLYNVLNLLDSRYHEFFPLTEKTARGINRMSTKSYLDLSSNMLETASKIAKDHFVIKYDEYVHVSEVVRWVRDTIKLIKLIFTNQEEQNEFKSKFELIPQPKTEKEKRLTKR